MGLINRTTVWVISSCKSSATEDLHNIDNPYSSPIKKWEDDLTRDLTRLPSKEQPNGRR